MSSLFRLRPFGAQHRFGIVLNVSALFVVILLCIIGIVSVKEESAWIIGVQNLARYDPNMARDRLSTHPVHSSPIPSEFSQAVVFFSGEIHRRFNDAESDSTDQNDGQSNVTKA